MHTYSFIVTFGKSNTFSLTINEDSKAEAIDKMNALCQGAIFKMVEHTEPSEV